jgi:hypothetical protein
MSMHVHQHLGMTMLLVMAASPAGAQNRVPVPGAPEVAMVVIPLPDGADVEHALPEVIEKVGAAQGGVAQHAKPIQTNVQGTSMRIETVAFRKAPGTGFFFLTTPGGHGICMAAIPLNRAARVARQTGVACLAAIATSPRPAGSAASPPLDAKPVVMPTPVGPAAHAANWNGVSGVYFRSNTTFGVGGMMVMDFLPLVLFKDGTFYEVGDAALEDVDLKVARAAHPNDWGRWTQQGDRFVLTDAKGRSDDFKLQDGNFFKAFPASGTGSLSGEYRTIGGGGNTAMGGEVMVAFENRYIFRADGTYSNNRSAGAMNNGSTSGVASTVGSRRGGQGRFSVDRYTITLERPDGSSERRFFAFGSQKSPALIDKDMLFIGDTVFSLDD